MTAPGTARRPRDNSSISMEYAPTCGCFEQRVLADLHGWGYGSNYKTCVHAIPYTPIEVCLTAPYGLSKGDRKRFRRETRAIAEAVCAALSMRCEVTR